MKKSELNSIILDDSSTLEEVANLTYKNNKRKKVKPLPEDFVINPGGFIWHILAFVVYFAPAFLSIILLVTGGNVLSGSKTDFISAGGLDRVSETKATGDLNMFNCYSIRLCATFVIVFTTSASILYIIANIKKSEKILYIISCLTALSAFTFIITVITNSFSNTSGGTGGGLTYGTSEAMTITGLGIFICILLSITAIIFIALSYEQYKKTKA